MTTLIVEELKAVTLVQQVTVTDKINLLAIRPYLYAHNNPAGTFTLSITTLSDVSLQSKTFTSAEIYTALGTVNSYAHAWFKVEFSNVVPLVAGTYKIKLSSSGYTFSEPSYLGWVSEYENLKVDLGYTPTGDFNNPFSYELWGYK